MTRSVWLLLISGLGISLAACQDDSPTASAAAGEAERLLAAGREPVPAGKLTAPIVLEYSVTGTPVVGQPVAVEVSVTTPLVDQPVQLSYRMVEAGSMTFPDSQPDRLTLAAAGNTERRSQPLTLTPQREGRLFLSVSAEIDSDIGAVMRSLSIPIQVGRGSGSPGTAGDLTESGDGEQGLSMPAAEPR